MSASAAQQLELELPEVYRHRLLMDRKLAAARVLVSERSIKVVADALDQIWGPIGHPCSASTLSNALRDHERSYWRSEWDSWFCDESVDFADVVAEMVGKGKAKKTADQIAADFEALVTEKLSAKEAAALIRKAKGL